MDEQAKCPAELPHPYLCFQHGGSPDGESENKKYKFVCPKCAKYVFFGFELGEKVMDEAITCFCGGQSWVLGTAGARCAKCGFWLDTDKIEYDVQVVNEYLQHMTPNEPEKARVEARDVEIRELKAEADKYRSDELKERYRAERAEAEIAEVRKVLEGQLDQARAEIERLRGIVDKLPKTADGVPVIQGDAVYVVADGAVHTMRAHAGGQTASGLTYSHVTHLCYSTREAAEAARKEGA